MLLNKDCIYTEQNKRNTVFPSSFFIMTTSKPIPSRKVSPPGPMAQYINKMLHTEPYSFIFHGLFWGTILTFACPMIGWALLVLTLSKGVRILLNWDMSNGMIDPKEEVSKGENRKEFAVYITGCDTGFGKDLTFALASKGFVVFPACLTENGIKQYQGEFLNILLIGALIFIFLYIYIYMYTTFSVSGHSCLTYYTLL